MPFPEHEEIAGGIMNVRSQHEQDNNHLIVLYYTTPCSLIQHISGMRIWTDIYKYIFCAMAYNILICLWK